MRRVQLRAVEHVDPAVVVEVLIATAVEDDPLVGPVEVRTVAAVAETVVEIAGDRRVDRERVARPQRAEPWRKIPVGRSERHVILQGLRLVRIGYELASEARRSCQAAIGTQQRVGGDRTWRVVVPVRLKHFLLGRARPGDQAVVAVADDQRADDVRAADEIGTGCVELGDPRIPIGRVGGRGRGRDHGGRKLQPHHLHGVVQGDEVLGVEHDQIDLLLVANEVHRLLAGLEDHLARPRGAIAIPVSEEEFATAVATRSG